MWPLLLIHSVTSQTRPTPARIAFSIRAAILKAIHTGVGWVWLARLSWSSCTSPVQSFLDKATTCLWMPSLTPNILMTTIYMDRFHVSNVLCFVCVRLPQKRMPMWGRMLCGCRRSCCSRWGRSTKLRVSFPDCTGYETTWPRGFSNKSI